MRMHESQDEYCTTELCLSVEKLKEEKTNKEDSSREETVLVYTCQCLCNAQSVTCCQQNEREKDACHLDAEGFTKHPNVKRFLKYNPTFVMLVCLSSILKPASNDMISDWALL